MSDFIVLGIIPGTNFQIGFLGWLAVFAVIIATLYGVRLERKSHFFLFVLIRISLAQSIKEATTRQQQA